ncbi:MAG: hypothetical protein ACRD6W_16075, partial [Nitrososphaerales archaeon]
MSKRLRVAERVRVLPMALVVRLSTWVEKRSELQYFDATWYLVAHPDVASSGLSALTHYVRFGEKEGRRPNPYFDPGWYLDQYPDVGSSGIMPLRHFVRFGEWEGRRPSQAFDPDWYLNEYPDVAGSGMAPLRHFLKFGAVEGRHPRLPARSDPFCDGAESRDPLSDAADNQDPWFLRSVVPRRGLELSARRSILVIDTAIPAVDEDSGSFRIFQLLAIMRTLDYDVTFVADRISAASMHLKAVCELGITVLFGVEDLSRHLQDPQARFETIWISRPEIATRYLPMARAFSPGSRVVYDTVDLHWRRFDRQSRYDPSVSRASVVHWRRMETTLFAQADAVVVTTDDDAALIRQDNGSVPITCIPNVHPEVGQTAPFVERRDLVFLGGFEHFPNVDAVHFFVSDLLPDIVRE